MPAEMLPDETPSSDELNKLFAPKVELVQPGNERDALVTLSSLDWTPGTSPKGPVLVSKQEFLTEQFLPVRQALSNETQEMLNVGVEILSNAKRKITMNKKGAEFIFPMEGLSLKFVEPKSTLSK